MLAEECGDHGVLVRFLADRSWRRSPGWVGPAGFHPHELRHTAASLAIASGADVEVLQLLLGHSTATPTLDLYGHLFPDTLPGLADRFEDAVCGPDLEPDPTPEVEEDDQ